MAEKALFHPLFSGDCSRLKKCSERRLQSRVVTRFTFEITFSFIRDFFASRQRSEGRNDKCAVKSLRMSLDGV